MITGDTKLIPASTTFGSSRGLDGRTVSTLAARIASGLLPIMLAVLAQLAIGPLTPGVIADAHAAGGQCVWEGGPGVAGGAGYEYCEAEDCIGDGGLAQCSAGQAAPPTGVEGSLLGADQWVHGMCHEGPGSMADDARWCQAGGGTWDAFSNPPQCLDQQEGMLGLTGTSTEQMAVEVTDAWIDIKFPSCENSLTGDTGWGQTINSNFCWTDSPGDHLDILVKDFRQRTYTRGGSCEGTTTVTLRRDRTAVCPPGYKSRNAVGGTQCFIPAECSQTCVGNPVSVVTGSKFQREDDYVVSGDTGIGFSRFYKSTGYYYPPEVNPFWITPGGLRATDVWRHSFGARLYIFLTNPYVDGVLQRPDGSLQVFDTDGAELTNRTSSGAVLVEVSSVGWDITQDDGSVERYDVDGKLISITTRAGLVTTLNYTGDFLSTVTGPFGHELSFDYDGDDRLVTVTLPDLEEITYGYDTSHRLVSVTYPDSSSRQYLYEDANSRYLLTGIVDENDVEFANYVYDSQGRVIGESHAGGVESYTFSYGQLGQPTAVTDPLGTTTNFGFSVAAGLYRPATYSQNCMSCGAFSSTTYDSKGNPNIRTDYEGNQTKYTFDTNRNLETSRIEAFGTSLARTITTQWHSTMRLPTQISEPGRQTDLTYDGDGNLLTVTITDTGTSAYRIWTYTYNGVGQVLSIDGPLSGSGDTTSVTYYNCSTGDECGQVASITDGANLTTNFLTYDAHGMPLTISDANGTVTTLTYDGRQRLTSSSVGTETTTFDYWPTGLIEKITAPDGSFIEYGYDDAQRLTEIVDTDGNRIEYALDDAGNRIAETIYDAFDTVVLSATHEFDGLGRLVNDVGSADQTSEFTYDLNGNLVTDEDPYGRLTEFGYDALNRLAYVRDPALNYTDFGYDDNDNLVEVGDPNGLVTSYDFNGFGDATALDSPDTGDSTTTRDAAGNVDIATDARNESGDYTFDGIGRVMGIEYGDQTIEFGYDSGTFGAGLLTEITDASGSTAWTYDALGRVVLREQVTGTAELETAYAYNSSGQLATMTTPSGQVIGFSYNANGRVSGIAVNSATLISQIGYEPFGPVNGWTWGNSSTMSRTFDTDGQLTSLSSGGESSAFTYYPDGRIATRVDSDPVVVPLATGTATFDIAQTSHRLSSVSGLISRSYSHDAAGNTLSNGAATFGYDDSGRMVSATAGATTTYAHNGLGERVAKDDGSATTYFVYDEAGHLLGEYDAAGGLIQETVWFGDLPVATLRPDGQSGIEVFYVHVDHLNTPRKITRPGDDEIIWRWDSDPFGETPADEDPDGDQASFTYNLRFPGQYFDGETGLHYNYFRDYDPVTGRYAQSDPIGLLGGINTYAYAGGNPLDNSDSHGLYFTSVDAACRWRPDFCAEIMGQVILNNAYISADPCRIAAAEELDQLIAPIQIVAAAVSVANLAKSGANLLSLLKNATNRPNAGLALPSPRNWLLDNVTDRTLRNRINNLYRPNARIGNGGTADAVRYELQTGQLLSPKGHFEKAILERDGLLRDLASGRLNETDARIARQLLSDLQNALQRQ